MTELENNMEEFREKLYSLLLNKELTDFNVILCSQELDKLHIQYEQLNE